jgi:hypothetical protein
MTESTLSAAATTIAMPIVQACTRRLYQPDTRSIELFEPYFNLALQLVEERVSSLSRSSTPSRRSFCPART